MKTQNSKFYEQLRDTKVEREVEGIYNEKINKYFNNTRLEHPFLCDGYLEKSIKYDKESKILRLLIEYKYDEDFTQKMHQARVIIQAIYYIKKFELAGLELPNIILIGDKNECFILDSNVLIKYLAEETNWAIAPSESADKNNELLLKISEDININPFIFRIDEAFSFKTIVDKINEMLFKVQNFVKITKHNIAAIYDYFITRVVKDISKYTANDLVYMFIDAMVSPLDNYKHPNKENILVLSNKSEIQINSNSYDSFYSYFERKYSPQEKEIFTETADRLIEDTTRRFKGEFYTPTIWCDEAHKMISEALGEDWREKYVVWDCAWGTGNLTRDYYFKELYCSTLNLSDLQIGHRYNNNSIKFQYDFFNDDIELLKGKMFLEEQFKLPKELLNAFKKDKPIIFFINPPYGTANNAGRKIGDHKEGIALTNVNKLMKKDGVGLCSQQLYAQFLYRILLMKKVYNLSDINICIYATSSYMTGSSFDKFRKVFLKEFKYNTGMLFKASYFSNVKGIWGIDFAIWKTGETENKREFLHVIKDISDNNSINHIGKKYLYNIDDTISCSDWIKEEVVKLKAYDAPQLGSALVVKSSGRGRLVDKALGYYVNVSNSVYKNTTDVFIVSSTSSMANGISIIPENYFKVISNFSARKLITNDYASWINQKDEYLVPNINHSRYEEWVNDCIILYGYKRNGILSK